VLDGVLVANRGEIALRIIRTCRRLGIRTAAEYSEADAGAPHVRSAERAFLIGPAPARESYLSIDRVLGAALDAGVAAIHPGYRFLSESWRFAEACRKAGLIFVGPFSEVIRAMGDKTEARRMAARAGVPVLPGSDGPVGSAGAAREIADTIGYPVMLKAASGGGGIGMAVVAGPDRLEAAFAAAQRRAQAAFGDTTVYVERAIESPRHVEVQVLGDEPGLPGRCGTHAVPRGRALRRWPRRCAPTSRAWCSRSSPGRVRGSWPGTRSWCWNR
jgi:acetyl/propionyl-CoA carboxylase alpha subunit